MFPVKTSKGSCNALNSLFYFIFHAKKFVVFSFSHDIVEGGHEGVWCLKNKIE